MHEIKLLYIAGRMFAAMSYFEKNPGMVTKEWMLKGLEKELVCITLSFMAELTAFCRLQ